MITIGVEEKAPNAPAPVNLKRHFTFRPGTVCELIGEAVVARVLFRSWLCAGHTFEAHSGGAWPTASPLAGELPAQLTIATTAMTTPTATNAAPPYTRDRILFLNGIVAPFDFGTPSNDRCAVLCTASRPPSASTPD